jgi:hypothetical protein
LTKLPYPVDHNVPVPKIVHRWNARYPWKELKINDSFFVPCAEIDLVGTRNALSSCRSWAQKKTGYKFVLRTMNQGIRVWRVE